MARCAHCRTTILFGGVSDGDRRFCNAKCHRAGALVRFSEQIDPEQVRTAVQQLHQGLCPKCGGTGPVDVATRHKVWSALVITSWSSDQTVGCRSCARKFQAEALLLSAVVGWWGIPWGLIMTPVQIVRNVRGMSRRFDPYQPSPELEQFIRLAMASELVQGSAPEA